MPFVRVALDVPLDRLFDYAVEAVTAADVGRRVVVPFGSRSLVGIVMAVADAPEDAGVAIKPVDAILEDMPALPADTLALLRFCADYYQHPIGQVVHTALPSRFRDIAPFHVAEALRYVATDAAALAAAIPARAVMQHRLVAMLAVPRSEAELRRVSGTAWKTVQAWMADGSVAVTRHEAAPIGDIVGLTLNADQTAAVQSIGSGKGFGAHLLQGITGSGKTEVYLQAIAAVLAAGKQALVLVPEINLTPQLEGRFRSRFPMVELAALHSSVADGERAAAWVKAARGEARIVLGTRLAVFTPMPALGLVIVDEEHDASYKQQDGLRYSARDMAVARAKRADVPVVLGSATPSLESWHNAAQGRYRHDYLRLRATPGAKPPAWRLIGTRHAPMTDGLHPMTVGAIAERLARCEQTLIFLNRRGYAPVMHCSECGWLAACTRCSARLTVHLREGRLRCHHCGWEERLPPRCPGCGNADVKPVGQGTQRLEDVLAARFPHACVMRIDRDSTRRKGSFEAALKAIHDGRVDILVGTQMLAKGHDFPKLTLVVVTGADSGLYSADYRAAERLFAQLAQVAGRAGRAEHPGEVLVQTDFPEHPLYQALLADDYDAFAQRELDERQLAGFPPILHQAVLRAEAAKLEEAVTFLRKASSLAPNVEGVTVWDPVPATMTRLANRERAQVLVQSHSRPRLQSMLAAWMLAMRQERAGKIRWSLDVDPLEL
jgi:primosomal protein N' (replication factor Y)